MSRRGVSFHLCSVTVALRSFLLSKFSTPSNCCAQTLDQPCYGTSDRIVSQGSSSWQVAAQAHLQVKYVSSLMK